MQRRSSVDRVIVFILVFAAVYPLVTVLSYLMQAVTPNWDLWQRNLVIVPMIVTAMMFVIIPAINRLRRQSGSPDR
jgi:antibiotic biosynthesis monooxygenase (ABM) superfamily enzyme